MTKAKTNDTASAPTEDKAVKAAPCSCGCEGRVEALESLVADLAEQLSKQGSKSGADFPFLATYRTSWRAVKSERTVAVIGLNERGEAIAFHDNFGVKSIPLTELERV